MSKPPTASKKKASSPKRVSVPVKRLSHGYGLDLPQYQSAQAAGMDLAAAVPETEPVRLAPGQRALVPTGLAIELPSGYEAQVRPRSGLALRHGITVLNAPGTIDADYRGEVMVLLINHGDTDWEIERGERIAQLVIQKYAQAELIETKEIEETLRGEGGFGSTGSSNRAAKAKSSKAGAAIKKPVRRKSDKKKKTRRVR